MVVLQPNSYQILGERESHTVDNATPLDISVNQLKPDERRNMANQGMRDLLHPASVTWSVYGRVLGYFEKAIVATPVLNCCQNLPFYPNCCRLPEVNCCILPNRSNSWQVIHKVTDRSDLPREIWTGGNCCRLRPEFLLIVACCGQKHCNCCVLRPNSYLLRVAGYLNTCQRCNRFGRICDCMCMWGWFI